MTIIDDPFDLDLRLSVGYGLPRADDMTDRPTEAIDTCSIGCQTETCETCGCNTTETCDHRFEDCTGIFTFGYCVDESDGCGEPSPGTAECADPPDPPD